MYLFLLNLKTIKIFYISEIIFSYITEVRWFLEGKRVKCDIPFEQEWNASCVCIFYMALKFQIQFVIKWYL